MVLSIIPNTEIRGLVRAGRLFSIMKRDHHHGYVEKS